MTARPCVPQSNRPANRPLSAAVFDGHGGFAAAEYLQQKLYKIFTRVLDQQGANLEMSQDMPGEPLRGDASACRSS